jgi:uncharacterized protein (TIGR02271 family)
MQTIPQEVIAVITNEQVRNIDGCTVHTTDGDKIGKVGQVYFDDVTGQAAWVTVQTGLFGTKETFVPLDQANMTDDGLVIPYAKDRVKDAPSMEVDHHLSQAEEQELYRYYGLDYQGGNDTGTAYTGTETGRTDTGRTETRTGTSDDAMTLSEEKLDVHTEKREAGRARLRKHVVTENVTKTVPVTREEVRVEREPITDANRDDALSGADFKEDEHEVVLHEERAVVDKETVPTERVRLAKDTVTDEQQVSDEVRKERLDTDGDLDRR